VLKQDLIEVPIIIADNLTKEQEKEFLIKDNVGFGEWDWDIIANEWDEVELIEWGLDIPLDFQTELEAEEDDFDVPADGIETDIVLGDLFEIGEHRLLCGDSTDSDQVAKLMNGQKADMCHTDPPYNINYEGGSKKREKIANDKLDDFPQFLYDVYTTISTALKKGGAIYVWHASAETHNFIQQSHQLKRKCYGMELDPKYCQVIIDRMKKLDATLVIKRCNDIDNVALDFAESCLHKQIAKGNPLSTIFYLKCKAKKRGYIEQNTIEIKGNMKFRADFGTSNLIQPPSESTEDTQ
jgi:hypothetical protein